ncbi:trypsin-like peptidase domain-containing protein [Streptomyces glomeratus]|uniref:Nephrocystin 3-like N-terminal domain-containing protein n=1 Tax=Streptomyces glomeratus TaxID=284452 RepID=A0ABP6LKB5_9ACTN|nr:trypsin-like peptidase domain-containing protein [Streptomyces glomeratus]MCF1511926.1 trypsin-like peptidase domain-containing protein [Streptomyces glomeratus]
MADLRADRAAEVISTRPDGTRLRGSGYLVATGLVLTAAHVVREAKTVTVRFNPDRADEWSAPARVGWFGPGVTDAALLTLGPGSPPESSPPRVDPVPFGAPGDDNAVLTCSAVGFPRFKMRQRPDGSRARDACHAWGHVPVLSNRRSNTLEFRVPPPERTAVGSPWEGMSGAAVWSEGHVIGIVVEHHHQEGTGTLTVSRADGWAGTADGPGDELLRRAGLEAPFERVGPSSGDVRMTEGFRAQARSIAPPELLGREREVEEVLRVCAGPGGYQWWQAPPWHGKTAFSAWLAAHPPPGVAVAAFFVTRRDASQCDSDAFAQAMTVQLAAVAGESTVHGTEPGVQVREWHRLLTAAARRQRQRGPLLVIVDGLDEDMSQAASPARPSIASLLPRLLPEGVTVLVTSRPGPGLPGDLPGDHPLRDCEPYTLAASAHATRLRYEAEYELRGLLAGDSAERQVIGLLAAAGEGLSREELCALTGMPAARLDMLTGGSLGRSLARRRFPVFRDGTADVRTALVFAHDTLLATALKLLGDELPAFRERLHGWADIMWERGWPQDTPHFLLSGYGRMALASAEPGRLARVAADPARHDRMASRLLGDGPALAELRAARDTVAQNGTEDGLRAAVLLAAAHDRLTARNRDVDDSEPALLRARLGQSDHAQALAEAMPDGGDKCFALIRLADFLAETEPRRALCMARTAVALLHDAPPSSYRSAPALAAVRVGGLLMRLGSGEGAHALHTALSMVAAERAARQGGTQDGEVIRWTDEVIVSAAESFGAAADLDGVRAVWSAGGHTGGRHVILTRALTALARHGHRSVAERLSDESPEAPDWPAALRAVWPTALAAAGAVEEAWHAVEDVDDVPPGDRDAVLVAMGEAFGEAGEFAQAVRAARTVTGPETRRRALLDLVARAPNARQGLRLIEEACPHGHNNAAPPADWPCAGACAALRVRALGTLDRWDEALAVAALPHPAAFRQEVRRQALTALALHGRWQQAQELLARYRAEEEPEHWVRAAVSLMYTGFHAGQPEAARLAEDLLAMPPGPLSTREQSRLESLATDVLARAGHWQALATHYSASSEPLRRLSLDHGSAAALAQAIAEEPDRRYERVAEALEALCPVFGSDAWRAALAPACARQGIWRLAASMARGIADPLSRRTALTRVAAALAEREPRHAAALADEAERTLVTQLGAYGPAADRERTLIGFAEALVCSRPQDAVRAARAASALSGSEDTRGRRAVVLARAGDEDAAVAALQEVGDRRWRCRTRVALVAAAVTSGRQDQARRLATDALRSPDTAAVPECVALIAAAGFHGSDAADELRREAVRWAASTALGVEDRVECLLGVLRHCPAQDGTTVSAAVRGLSDALALGLTPGRVLPLAASAAVALEALDREAAARFATRALEAAAALDPVTPGEAPASAVAGATAVLCRVGDLSSALRAPGSRVPDGRGDVLPVLLAGAAAGAVSAAPDWAAAQADEAADLLREYRGRLGSHPALEPREFVLTEPVLDCLTTTARALAALDDRPAAGTLLQHVRLPWQQDLAWARLAQTLADEAGRDEADHVVREAADWALRQALAGDRWTAVLPLVAADHPDAVAEACALTLGIVADRPTPDPSRRGPAGVHPVGPSC